MPTSSRETVRSNAVLNDSLTGSDISSLPVAISPTGASGPPTSRLTRSGRRAYGYVAANGTLTRSKNVHSVDKLGTGGYCIRPASGITVASSVLIVTQELSSSGTNTGQENFGIVLWDSNSGPCSVDGTPRFTVKSFFYNGDSLDNDDGGGTAIG